MVATIGSIEVTLKLLGADKYAVDFRNSALATENAAKRIDSSTLSAAKSTDTLGASLAALTRGNSGLNTLALSALRAETSIGSLTKGITALSAAVGGIGGALAVKAVTNYADAYTNVQNRIASVVASSKERIGVEQDLFDLSQRTRSSFDATVQLYQRLTLASRNLGATQHDIMRVVETTQKAFVTGGSTVQEAASTATQLAQALGSGRLQGDEFRAIAENAPVLFQAIAKQFGVSTGQLKEMSSAGLLDAKAVFRAILASTSEVDDAFAQTAPTIAAGIQQIDNALTRYIGQTDKSLGASERLAGGLKFVADNISTIGDAAQAAVAVIGGTLLSRLLVGRNTADGFGGVAGAMIAPFRRVTAEANAAISQAKAAQEVAENALASARRSLSEIQNRAISDRISFADRDVRRAAANSEKDVARAAARGEDTTGLRSRADNLAAIAAQNANLRAAQAVAAARKEVGAANAAIAASSAAMATAERRAGAFGSALAGAMSIGRTAVSGLIGLLGGPFGAALTAASVGIVGYQLYQARAAATAEDHRRAIEGLVGALERHKAAQDRVSQGQSAASDLRELRRQADEARQAVDAARAEASNLVLRSVQPKIGGEDARTDDALKAAVERTNALRAELNQLFSDIAEGKKEPEELAKRLNALGMANPSTEAVRSELLKLAQQAAGAAGQLGRLLSGIDALASAQAGIDFNIRGMLLDPQNSTNMRSQLAQQRRAQENRDAEQIEKDWVESEVKRSKGRQDLREKLEIAELRAAGKGREAFIRENDARYGGASPAQIGRLYDLQEAAKPARKSPSQRDEERLDKKLTQLGQDAAVAGLSDLDQKTVRFAQSARVAAENVDAFIKALQSGDLSKIPPQMEQIRQGIEKLEASRFARGQLDELFPARKMETQIRQLVEASKTMPEVAANFDALVEKVRATNASDFSKGMASSISDFASSAILDFKNIGDAATNLSKALLKVALNAVLLKPLENLISSSLGSAFGNISFGSLFGGSNPLSNATSGPLQLIGRNARGTDNWRGGWSFVGEEGPELVNLPAGSRVIPNNRLATFRPLDASALNVPVGPSPAEYASAIRSSVIAGAEMSMVRTQSVTASVTAATRDMPRGDGGLNVTINEGAGVQATAKREADGSLTIDAVMRSVDANIANGLMTGRGMTGKAARAVAGKAQLRG